MARPRRDRIDKGGNPVLAFLLVGGILAALLFVPQFAGVKETVIGGATTIVNEIVQVIGGDPPQAQGPAGARSFDISAAATGGGAAWNCFDGDDLHQFTVNGDFYNVSMASAVDGGAIQTWSNLQWSGILGTGFSVTFTANATNATGTQTYTEGGFLLSFENEVFALSGIDVC